MAKRMSQLARKASLRAWCTIRLLDVAFPCSTLLTLCGNGVLATEESRDTSI
jgi:hypothetical protein